MAILYQNIKKDTPTCKYVLRTTKFSGASSAENNTRSHDDIFPIKKVKFNEYLLPAPNKPEAIFKKQYGENYMSLPPSIKPKHGLSQVID